ncbi:MAG: quinone-dependent dihydroorotate dehydrogenase, partial [Chitinophagaceae bacterium]|nr:quinone-dependent dihydroorotate dehydrogenase [Chitinophagaceae bacterium]
MFYPFVRSILFNLSPEKAHYFSMNMLRSGCNFLPLKKIFSSIYTYKHPSLTKNIFGLPFRNPVGLGAGFDKNALYLNALETLGFGSVEIGTVTPLAQPGNEQPRLFRLPLDRALINRMGFNNDGVELIKKRLDKWNSRRVEPQNGGMVIGGNIGKNKVTDNKDAWKDYETCFKGLFDCVDYFTINVSSPNTPGLRELQEKDALLKIFSVLQNFNQGKKKPKPLLLKIAPDLTNKQLDDIIALTKETGLSGLVATNTTTGRENLLASQQKIEKIGAGGLSGKPIQSRTTGVLKYLSDAFHGCIPLIAGGGIFTGEDAKEKLEAGASLL